MFRTPAKNAPQTDETAGPSLSSVRRSIGEWEAGQAKPQFKSSTGSSRSNDSPPAKGDQVLAGSATTQAACQKSTEVAGSLANPRANSKYPNLTAEARACLNKAKLHLGNSRNLKTEIKTEVLGAIDRLYQLVKESEQQKAKGSDRLATPQSALSAGEGRQPEPCLTLVSSNEALIVKLQEHSALMQECNHKIEGLNGALKKEGEERATASAQAGPLHPTYAEAVSQPRAVTAVHSVIVASADVQDSCEDIVQRIRTVIDAKSTGLRVDRLRKAKDQKVIVGCSSKAELARVAERLRTPQAKFLVEEKANKDPLVILKYVLAYNSDEDIVKALFTQNGHLLGDLSQQELRARVRYRRRVRNPHECHVVLSVSPQGWQRLTKAGHVHVDLQRVQVLDQSPLVQCIRCLRYGHSRKACEEPADLCTHCGDAHLRADCPSRLAANKPTCNNCRLASLPEDGHDALDSGCPTRAKWEALARSSVAYC